MAGRRGSQRSFEEWYADAAAYYRDHGDLLIPEDYCTPEGWKLGKWLDRQRGKYHGRPSVQGTLTKTQIGLLEKIGMVWRLEHRFSTEEWLAICKEYYHIHGDLLVPANYCIHDHHLGNWIKKQRSRYHQGLLPQEMVDELDSLEMNWSAGFRRDWMAWYADAREYAKNHGDLMVPTTYRTKEGYALGVWISVQRGKYHGTKGNCRLNKEQIRALEAIGMCWRVKKAA